MFMNSKFFSYSNGNIFNKGSPIMIFFFYKVQKLSAHSAKKKFFQFPNLPQPSDVIEPGCHRTGSGPFLRITIIKPGSYSLQIAKKGLYGISLLPYPKFKFYLIPCRFKCSGKLIHNTKDAFK
jgi:hypothetical protein